MSKFVGSSYEVIGKVATVSAPIVFLGAKNDGFPEIGVWVQGGGVQRGYEAVLAAEKGQISSFSIYLWKARSGRKGDHTYRAR